MLDNRNCERYTLEAPARTTDETFPFGLNETRGMCKRLGERERPFDDKKHDGLAIGELEEPEDKRNEEAGAKTKDTFQ